jgi:hypothetical protein
VDVVEMMEVLLVVDVELEDVVVDDEVLLVVEVDVEVVDDVLVVVDVVVVTGAVYVKLEVLDIVGWYAPQVALTL